MRAELFLPAWLRDWSRAEGGHRSGARRLERRKARRGAQAPDRKFFLFEFLSDEHCVAVAEKSVTLLHGLLVGVQNVLAAGKRADQHYQGAFGRVEICEHLVDDFEFVAWIHKNVRAGGSGFYGAVFVAC